MLAISTSDALLEELAAFAIARIHRTIELVYGDAKVLDDILRPLVVVLHAQRVGCSQRAFFEAVHAHEVAAIMCFTEALKTGALTASPEALQQTLCGAAL